MEFLKIDKKNVKRALRKLSHLVFEVTDRCNLNCNYCAYSELYRDYDERIGADMSFAKAKQIICYMYNLWKDSYSEGLNRKVTIGFYGGEPLLNISLVKQIIGYLENLEGIGIVYSFAMTTNGMLLDEHMDFLAEKKFQILISLDGDEFSQSYRVDHFGRNSFSQVFNNVKLVQEKHPDFFENCINFCSVLHSRNDMEPVFQFINANFGKVPLFSTLSETGICETKKDEFRKMFRNPSESFYRSKNCSVLENELMDMTPRVKALADYIQHQSGNIFKTYNQLFVCRSALSLPATGTCVPFIRRMFISVQGKILPCERIGHQFSLGQVYDDHVVLDEEYIADVHNQYTSKYIDQCVDCALKWRCAKCVYQIADLLSEKTRCNSFLSTNDLAKYNEVVFEFLQANPQYYRKIVEHKAMLSRID